MPDTWHSETKERRNERVALEVMGYHRGTRIANRHSWYDSQHQRVSQDHMYRPTEDIGWAWKVAEFLHHKHRLSARVTIYYDEGISVGRFFGHKRGWQAESATAPDAICHAAVLAVGGMD